MADESNLPDYATFLEGLDEHELQMLVEGKAEALLVDAGDGLALLAEIMEAEERERGSGQEPFMARLAACTTQREALQLLANLSRLGEMIAVMINRSKHRLRVLHRQECADCREGHEKQERTRRQFQRGLEAARAAFAEALAEDEEPWKQGLDPEDEDEGQ